LLLPEIRASPKQERIKKPKPGRPILLTLDGDFYLKVKGNDWGLGKFPPGKGGLTAGKSPGKAVTSDSPVGPGSQGQPQFY